MLVVGQMCGLFCRYTRSQNAHLRGVNFAFSNFADLKLISYQQKRETQSPYNKLFLRIKQLLQPIQ